MPHVAQSRFSPGTYVDGNSWVRKSHHVAPTPPRQRINFQKVPSAPSIPARDQSYGYEEGDGGLLVQQKPQVCVR